MSFGSTKPALSIEKLTVRPDRVIARVRVNSGAPRMTTPALAKRLVQERPSLSRHSCVNEQGDTFGAVLSCTPLPHVLEHLVIDEQVRSAQASDAVYTGTTRWLDESIGVAEVAVSYTDDLVALSSFQTALRILNQIMAA